MFASHRAGRPWVGDTAGSSSGANPVYDPTCYLCPGNKRVGGHNEDYTGVFCFTNDLPAFSDVEETSDSGDELYRARPALGTAEVVCYHPNHAMTFADLSVDQAAAVVRVWRERSIALAQRREIDHVAIFENKGTLVGASNLHPHCQIYAGNLVFSSTERELAAAIRFHEQTGKRLGEAVLEREAAGGRVICQNDSFLACVPWFARYAYEVLVLPKRPVAALADLDEAACVDLAAIMREVCIRYDNLWRMPLPYVMAIHQAPCDGNDNSLFPFHLEYHPPLRKPDTMKYLAGSEIGCGLMTNESDPDEKAAELQAVSAELYRPRPAEWD